MLSTCVQMKQAGPCLWVQFQSLASINLDQISGKAEFLQGVVSIAQVNALSVKVMTQQGIPLSSNELVPTCENLINGWTPFFEGIPRMVTQQDSDRQIIDKIHKLCIQPFNMLCAFIQKLVDTMLKDEAVVRDGNQVEVVLGVVVPFTSLLLGMCDLGSRQGKYDFSLMNAAFRHSIRLLASVRRISTSAQPATVSKYSHVVSELFTLLSSRLCDHNKSMISLLDGDVGMLLLF